MNFFLDFRVIVDKHVPQKAAEKIKFEKFNNYRILRDLLWVTRLGRSVYVFWKRKTPSDVDLSSHGVICMAQL